MDGKYLMPDNEGIYDTTQRKLVSSLMSNIVVLFQFEIGCSVGVEAGGLEN